MITFTFTASADATGTPTLGIVRNDTDATVVAAGTPMIAGPAGSHSWSYTFTGDSPGVSYTATYSAVIDGITASWSSTQVSPQAGMTLTDARDIVRRRLKSGNDTSRYEDADIDDAILLVGNDFVNRTGCTTTSAAIAMTAASDQVDFSSLDGFRPERLRGIDISPDTNYTATLLGEGLQRTSIEEIRRQQSINPDATGTPTMIAFSTLGTATLYPIPQFDGTIGAWWTQPFVSFTSGTTESDGITLNIPADLIYPVLIYGATVIVQITEVENIEKALRTGAYEQHVQRSLGMGTLAPQIVQRVACSQL